MPCETRKTGLIELNGSWKTIGTRLRYRSICSRERRPDSGSPWK